MSHQNALIVLDDEPAILDLLVHSLAPSAWSMGDSERHVPCARDVQQGDLAGVRFLVAQTAEDAIRLAKAHLAEGGRLAGGFFDLHLSEGIQGHEAMRRLRELQPGLLCTVITGMPGQLDAVLEVFAPNHLDEWDFVSKPFTRGEIQQRCRQMLAASERRLREAAHVAEIERLNTELSLWGRSLEKRVAERTEQLAEALRHLRAKNVELEEVLEALHSTQAELVQQEKMATIGQLAAGVARELSRPLAFTQHSLAGLVGVIERLAAFATDVETQSAPRPESSDEAVALRRSFADLCRAHRSEASRAEADNLVSHAAEGLERAGGIVRELSAFASASNGLQQPVDISRTLATAIDLVRGSMARAEHLEADIPELPSVEGSAQELQHAWLQLLRNAIEATEGRPGDAHITISAKQSGDEIVVEFSDNGDGIPLELRDRVFEPFFTTRGRRPGLGLSVVHGVIRRHGGNIEIDDVEPTGTLFRIHLPIMVTAEIHAC